jgi:hypothetical protein
MFSNPKNLTWHEKWEALPQSDEPTPQSLGMVFAFDDNVFSGVDDYLEHLASCDLEIGSGEPTWAEPVLLDPPCLMDIWSDQGNDEFDPPDWMQKLNAHIREEFKKPSGLYGSGSVRPVLPEKNPYAYEDVK